jgi:CheY-like chemotaxis protein
MSKRLLIVEDHTAIRKMLVAMFKNAGYEVIEADNGATGLAHAQAGGFYGIILDLKMPQMDGLHFLQAIKQTPPTVPNGPHDRLLLRRICLCQRASSKSRRGCLYPKRRPPIN